MAKVVEILVVEDNPGDVRLLQESFKRNKMSNNLHVVRNGEDAMLFLRREGAYAEAVTPDLILLDLNLPKKDGREVLADIRADPNLTHLPVVVLTSSEDEEDILKSYKLHANCYITKPVTLERFVEVINSIDGFWLSLVKLPSDKE